MAGIVTIVLVYEEEEITEIKAFKTKTLAYNYCDSIIDKSIEEGSVHKEDSALLKKILRMDDCLDYWMEIKTLEVETEDSRAGE